MKIKKSGLGFFFNILICLAFFNVQAINQVPVLDTIIDIFRLVIFGYLLCAWSLKKTIKKHQIVIMILFASRLLATALNGDEVGPVLNMFFPIITMLFWVDKYNNRLPTLIKSIYVSSFLLVVANFLTLVLFPDGWYSTNYWLIGQKQDWYTVYISFFFSSILLWNEKKLRVSTIICFVIMLCSFLYQFPFGLVMYFIITIGTVYLFKNRKNLKANTLFFINLIAEFWVCIIAFSFEKIVWLNNLLMLFSANEVMTKRDTFYMRVCMWREGLNAFADHPILGIGTISSDRWSSIIHLIGYHPHFHNTPIDVITTSGIVGITSFVAFYIMLSKHLDKARSKNSILLTCGYFGINVLMLTEGIYAPFIWLFLFVGIYIRQLDIAFNQKSSSIKIN